MLPAVHMRLHARCAVRTSAALRWFGPLLLLLLPAASGVGSWDTPNLLRPGLPESSSFEPLRAIRLLMRELTTALPADKNESAALRVFPPRATHGLGDEVGVDSAAQAQAFLMASLAATAPQTVIGQSNKEQDQDIMHELVGYAMSLFLG